MPFNPSFLLTVKAGDTSSLQKHAFSLFMMPVALLEKKGSIPATVSKTGQITLHSSSLLPSPHLYSAGQPNSIMNMKCLLIDVYGS